MQTLGINNSFSKLIKMSIWIIGFNSNKTKVYKWNTTDIRTEVRQELL